MNIIRNKISKGLVLAISVLALSSCNDWLDVKLETEEREQDMFSNYKGYKEALAGCYVSMASQNIYGKNLTMSDVECLANLWQEPNKSYNPDCYYFHQHNYTADEARSGIKSIYSGLFNVVVQTNMIINHITAKPSSIADENARNVVEGEALALRAYCQFDVLRLFGQLPQGGTKKVSLPYSESNDINTLPPYYSFEDYTQKLLNDLDKAETLFSKSDPLLKYSYYDLSGSDNTLDDDFMMNRRHRMNLWAVKALKARVYMYLGNTTKAYEQAKAVINATLNGKPVVRLAGDGDYSSGYYALPDECLFALQNSNLLDYSIATLGGLVSQNVAAEHQLCITTNMLDKQLYAGQNTTSNNRYLNMWERNTHNSAGIKYPTIKKYSWDSSKSISLDVLRLNLQIMPMLRLSEQYLIAMETTTDLAEANTLYTEYMKARAVNVTEEFTSLDEVKDFVLDEYRREFYGEGQMFYAYKRKNTKRMLFATTDMEEGDYILPLPESEFNPN